MNPFYLLLLMPLVPHLLSTHELASAEEAERPGAISRAILSLQWLSRLVIYAIQSSAIGAPFNYDAVAFWAHSICVRAALVHIKYGIHVDEWEPGLQVLKAYLRSFEPRYKIYGM